MLVYARSRRVDCALSGSHPVHAAAGQLDPQLAPVRLEGGARVARRGHQSRHRHDASALPDVACRRGAVGGECVPAAAGRRGLVADAVPRERAALLVARSNARTPSASNTASQLLQLRRVHVAATAVGDVRCGAARLALRSFLLRARHAALLEPQAQLLHQRLRYLRQSQWSQRPRR